jgi:hypothetical protein
MAASTMLSQHKQLQGPSGPSYVNRPGSAPICDATLDVAFKHLPVPAGSLHSTEVVEIQLLVAHGVAPMDIDGDVSIGPKFVPDSVSVEPPVVGPFKVLALVSTGAAPYPPICPLDRI